MKRLAFILSATLALCPATSWAQATGAEAFAQRDFATAEQIWTQEAAAGSAEAMLGLGLLADRGFNGSRDFAAAFEWYMKAAALGLAEAQFNIAVMYDAGLGRDRDTAQALIWYTRAALRDYPRAQYNLGLLYESGDGVSANADLARYWFAQAAPDLPAAAAKTVAPVAAPAQTTIPAVLFSQVTPNSVELVWASPATDDATYIIEVLQTPEFDADYQAPITTLQTQSSGLLLNDIALRDDAVWRIVNRRVDGSDYDATPWQSPSGQVGPKGRVTLVVGDALPAMRAAAAIFADDLRTAGYWVRVQDGDQRGNIDGTRVVYGYAADRDMADLVARYLPGLPDDKQVVARPDSTQPTEIEVYFAASR